MTQTCRRDRRGVRGSRAHRSLALVFLCLGALFADWVPRIPQIKDAAGLSDGELGTAMIGTPIGTLAALRPAARLISRHGSRTVIRLGVLASAVALLLPAVARNLWTLSLGLAVLGTALGVTEVAMNAQGVAVERKLGRPVMSGLHGAYSLGGLLGALLGSAAAHLGVSPLVHFSVAGACIAAATWAASSALPEEAAPEPGPSTPGRGKASMVVPLLGLIAFCSFLGEGTVENSSAVCLRDDFGAPAGIAGLGWAGCTGAMTVVRLGGDRMIKRFGPVTVLRAGALLAALGLITESLWAAVSIGIAGFVLYGAGIALVAPVAFSAAGNVPGIPAALAIARVTAVGHVGFIAGPPLIGFTGELLGLRDALLIPAALAVVIVALADVTRPVGRGATR